jgi:hypothetical protein
MNYWKERWRRMHEREPNPEPAREPFDAHVGPLDDDDDARYLDPADPRRLDIERERGRPFNAEEP